MFETAGRRLPQTKGVVSSVCQMDCGHIKGKGNVKVGTAVAGEPVKRLVLSSKVKLIRSDS